MSYSTHILEWPTIENLEEALLLQAQKTPGLIVKADDDGYWQQQLSPRYNGLSFEDRMQPFANLLDALKQHAIAFAVALTIEELCPGGIDATDGIALARLCEAKGAVAIIACCGTKDFPALKFRKPTQLKNSHDTFTHNEPWLASALWLVGKVQIPIIAKGSPLDVDKARSIAQQLGITDIQQI